MKIKVIDPIICEVIEGKQKLSEFLTITEEYFYKDKYGITGDKKIRKEKTHSLVDKNGYFPTGLLPRIIKKFPETIIEGELQKLSFNKNIDPPGITLLTDQREQVLKGLEIQRGIIEAPTGTGKTVLLYALSQAFKTKRKVLITFPFTAIFKQTQEDFKKWGVNFSVVGDGKKDISGKVVLAMDKSFKNMNIADICDQFDVVLIDEAHSCSSLDGIYSKILSSLLAPVRIGVTATPHNPKSVKGIITESLLGPIISEFTIEEAVEKKRLARPKLELISVPKSGNIKELYTYQDIYKAAIVNNNYRHSLIAKYILNRCIPNGNSFIAFTYMVEHAEKLWQMLIGKGIKAHLVTGNISVADREIIKKNLESKIINGVVATNAWKTGLNIKSLNCIINASGYKDNIPITQMAGRGLRIIPDVKEEAIIVDFLDLGKHISEHSVQRLQVYISLGFEIKGV